MQIFEHVSPQELEKVGESLKGPLKYVGILRVQELGDGVENTWEMCVEVVL